MDLQFHIPVKPHIKRYIQYYYPYSPFKITTNNEIGAFLYMCLERRPTFNEKPIDFGARIQVEVNEHIQQSQGAFINNRKVMVFNKAMDKIIRNKLFELIDDMAYSKGDIQTVILDYIAKYDIDPKDLSLETLRRDYNRYKLRLIA